MHRAEGLTISVAALVGVKSYGRELLGVAP